MDLLDPNSFEATSVYYIFDSRKEIWQRFLCVQKG